LPIADFAATHIRRSAIGDRQCYATSLNGNPPKPTYVATGVHIGPAMPRGFS
jgi:hypothetical protein